MSIILRLRDRVIRPEQDGVTADDQALDLLTTPIRFGEIPAAEGGLAQLLSPNMGPRLSCRSGRRKSNASRR